MPFHSPLNNNRPAMLVISLCAAFPLATPAVHFQEGEPQVDVVRTKTPIEVVVGYLQEDGGKGEARGEPQLLSVDPQPVEAQNDSVPLPIPAVGYAGPDGDEWLSEPSGDPFFLGFAAGPYYPPEGELVDPELSEQFASIGDMRPGDFTYACIMFSKRMTAERLGLLESIGCRLLGLHPYYTVKVALSRDNLADVSTLPFVRWVGPPKAWQKLSPHTAEILKDSGDGQLLPFHVSVWESDLNARSRATKIGRVDVVNNGIQSAPDTESDQRLEIWRSNGWMQAALEQKGIQVDRYTPEIDTFQVQVRREQLSVLTGLDFVLFVEPVLVPTFAMKVTPHDESIAMIMADHVRGDFDGGTNKVAIAGIIDSGVELDHVDFSGLTGVGWACSTTTDPWDDDIENGGNGHGTHVSGTILGRGVAAPDHLGNAPGLASWGGTSRYFNYRGFSPGSCLNGGVSVATSKFASSYLDSNGDTTAKPMVINNSWGYSLTGSPIGSEANCRTLDDAVYNNDQLYIFASGNEGSAAGTCRIEPSAKNVVSVGSVVDYIDGTVGDPGNLWTTSSRGPTGDGRWKPNITAPGRLINSLLANNTTGYTNGNGTSMAAPHVTGAAAQLCDHFNWLRYDPPLLSAVLMASAIPNDDTVLTQPTDAHLDTYGAGRLNAYKANWTDSDMTYSAWSFGQDNTFWVPGDFTVPAGTTRIVAVMRYTEAACSAGASQALVNDYDLWLDQGADDPGGNTGEYFIQQSQIDNTEIRIIDNPIPGAWRWKSWPDSASNALVKMGVVIYFMFDDPSPDASLTLSADDSAVQPGETVNVQATVDVGSCIASAVVLDRSGTSATLVSSSTVTYDGVVTDLTDSASSGADIVLGDTLHSQNRTGSWGLSYALEGTKVVKVNARSDNMVDQAATINVIVDGTAPGSVSALTSSSHTPGVWSNDPKITWTWNAATDALSGIQGYGIYETTGCSPPGAILDIGAVTTHTGGPYSSSLSGRAFNIRSVDNADNWEANYVCDANYLIDVDRPTAATFNSSSHNIGGKSCNSTITVNWNAGTDAHSGVDGYGYFWSPTPVDCSTSFFLYTSGTTETETLGNGVWYLHVMTKDVAGNWVDCSDFAHFGPFTLSSCTIFADDFESGGYAFGGWTTSSAGRCKVNAKSAFNGAFGARLKKGGQGTGPCTVGVAAKQTWIQAPPVDTTGWSGVRVDMNAHFRKNTLSCEYLDLQWWDGAAWQSAGIVEKHAWAPYSFNLPAGALGNPALSLRLITNSKGKGEKAEVDDFAVIGIE